jgi:hypothetical protein
MNKPILACTFLWCALAGFTATRTHAAPVTFTIDPTQSSLTISGSFQGAPFSQQSAGSLIDNYAGLINGDLTGSTVTFAGGSSVAALLHPNGALFTPAGIGVTNYGVAIAAIPGQVGAYRDLILDLTGGAATNGVAGGQTLAFSAGHLDYDGPATGPGSLNLIGASAVNSSAALASLTTAGLVQTLRIPVMLNMNDGAGLIQTLDGTIVATRAVPEPSSALTLAVGVCLAWLMGRRRR